jgi:hypothetical protein
MKNYSTAEDSRRAARSVKATTTENEYPGPLAQFVEGVESMRNYLVGASLAHGVARELGTLLGRKGWLLPHQLEGWPD